MRTVVAETGTLPTQTPHVQVNMGAAQALICETTELVLCRENNNISYFYFTLM